MNIEDKTIEHYASLIIIMREKLDIDISQETADNILYEWLTDKEVRKYLNNGVSTDIDILKLHEEISSISKKNCFLVQLLLKKIKSHLSSRLNLSDLDLEPNSVRGLL